MKRKLIIALLASMIMAAPVAASEEDRIARL